jgi:hypothetical protein
MFKQYEVISRIKSSLHDNKLPEKEYEFLRDYFRSFSILNDEYETVAVYVIRNVAKDQKLLNEFVHRAKLTVSEYFESNNFVDNQAYDLAEILSALSSEWNCSIELRSVVNSAIDNCRNEDFYELIFISTIVVGQNVFDGYDREYERKLFNFGKLFFDESDETTAKDFACGICIAKNGRTVDCFRPKTLEIFKDTIE